jgi:hypothetical protein
VHQFARPLEFDALWQNDRARELFRLRRRLGEGGMDRVFCLGSGTLKLTEAIAQ